MNNKQGLNPIKDQISYQELAQNNAPANFPRPRISELIEQNLCLDGNSLANSILFACHKCDGPLVPSSECQVCNRTSLRKCTKCGNEVQIGSHQSCEFLVFLKILRTNQSDPQRKSVVNS